MLEKYIYIFDAIIFITGICSFFINLKRDKSMFNSVVSILIGIFGVLIAHVIYVIIDGKWLNGELTIIIFAIMEFIEILLLFKKKNWKAYIISILTTILIAISILYANQQDTQNIFNYSLNDETNVATINGFSKEYNKSNLKIPNYIIKGLRFYKVTSIDEKAFYGCEKLYHVKLPNSIKNIENYAFAESGINIINIPDNIETIGAKAFLYTAKDVQTSIKTNVNTKYYDSLTEHIELNYENSNYNGSIGTVYYTFKEGLCLVDLGYIDENGRLVIDRLQEVSPNYEPYNYYSVGSFSEGLARVCRNQKYGYIDISGKEIIPCIYDYAFDFSEGLALVKENGKFGYIDTKGNVAINFQFEDPLTRMGSVVRKSDIGLFKNGLACVKMNGKYGYIDKKGNVIVDFKFNSASAFYDGLAFTDTGYIDKSGNVVISSDEYTIIFRDFSDGLVCAKKNEKYGFIDTKGNVVIDFQYDKAFDFSEGLACVSKNDKYGYIDKNGNVIIDFQYSDAHRFSNGLAYARKNNKYGYINKEGKVIIDFQFDDAFDFSEELALTKKDEKYQFINKNGEIVIDKIEVNELIFSD